MILTTRQGVKIAIVAGTFSLNGIPTPPGKPWAVARLDPQSMLRRARQARRAGADIVIVAAHAGTEYAARENTQQRQLAKALTASADVDLVYMHHAHVVQPWTEDQREVGDLTDSATRWPSTPRSRPAGTRGSPRG